MTNFDVVTIGAATLDIVMRSENFQVIADRDVPGGMALCQIYGSKTEVSDVTITSGGGATNTAVSFAKKELKCACISELGEDAAASVVKADLESAGVDTGLLIQESKETTAVSTILVPKDGQRSIMVYRGASAMITERDIPWESLKTRWIHVTSLGGNLRLARKLFVWAKKNDIRVSWNPGMTELEKSREAASLCELVEILFVNKEEAVALFGEGMKNLRIVEKMPSPSTAHVTVITDGEHGGLMWSPEGFGKFDPVRIKKVLDTTGVGDAFASGMVAGVLFGKNYEQALNWGLKNAESVLKYVGAKNKLLTLAEINK